MPYHLFIGNRVYSSWSMRGWLLLRAFGIEFETELVRLQHAQFEHYRQSCFPAATVPALKISDGDGEQLVWDSLAMAECLHERHPEAGIWPDSAVARAAARSLAAEMHSSYPALRGQLPMNTRRVYPDFALHDETRQDIDRILSLWRWAVDRFGSDGPYLFGPSLCAADVFYAPVASRFRSYQVELDSDSARYVDSLLAHPAVREFYADGAAEPWLLEPIEFG